MTCITRQTGNRHTARHHHRETSALGRPGRIATRILCTRRVRREGISSSTDAIIDGMPPHIASSSVHKDIGVTTSATRPSTPRKPSTPTGRSSPGAAALGPAGNTVPPPRKNGTTSSPTSNSASCRWAPAAAPSPPPASTSTPDIRCPLLRPDPAQRPRLAQIRDNLTARIGEAQREGWTGEAEGLQVSLAAAHQETRPDGPDRCPAAPPPVIHLGMPGQAPAVSRTVTTAATLPEHTR